MSASSPPTRSDSPGRYRSLLVCAYATTSFTSMLPRVALEYGQTMWAFCTKASIRLVRTLREIPVKNTAAARKC